MMNFLKKIEARLAKLLDRALVSVRMAYYRLRIRKVLRYFDTKGLYIGESCPHEVRIPMEAVRRLNKFERVMLDKALLYSARPYGATLHVCLRCYCLTRSTHKKTVLGY